MATEDLFKWRHFLPEVILLNVRWYCRYSLSYRDLEEMMAKRGVEVDHSTIFRWVQLMLLKWTSVFDLTLRQRMTPGEWMKLIAKSKDSGAIFTEP